MNTPSPQEIIALLQQNLADKPAMQPLLCAHLMLSPFDAPFPLFVAEEDRLLEATRLLLSRLNLDKPLHGGWLQGVWDRAAESASKSGFETCWVRWQVLSEVVQLVALGRLAWER